MPFRTAKYEADYRCKSARHLQTYAATLGLGTSSPERNSYTLDVEEEREVEGEDEASPERNKRKRLNLTDDMERNRHNAFGADGDAATFVVDEEEAKEEEKLSHVKRKRQFRPLLPLKRRTTGG